MKQKFLTILIIIFSNIIIYAQCWKMVDTGQQVSFGIKKNGTLWSWGDNQTGELGIGVQIYQSNIPRQVTQDTNWVFISSNQYYALAIKSNGSLWAWGDNMDCQLGNNSVIPSSFPKQVGIDTDWSTVSVGGRHNHAIKTNGSLWGWGNNEQGQVGIGDTIDVCEPIQIGLDTNWMDVSAGFGHTIALKRDGSLWAWGYNGNGQVGDSTFQIRKIPTKIGIENDWTNISTQGYHNLALKNNGSLWGWGSNLDSELGIGNISYGKNYPFKIGTDNDWKYINAFSSCSKAIKTDSSLWVWGNNDYGQLGDGTNIRRDFPINVSQDIKWKKIVGSSSFFSIGLDEFETLYFVGNNDFGQFGNGTTDSMLSLTANNEICMATNSNIYKFLEIFPNPVITSFCLKHDTEQIIEDIKIFNNKGEVIGFNYISDDNIDISKFASGVYFVKIILEDRVVQQKIIKF